MPEVVETAPGGSNTTTAYTLVSAAPVPRMSGDGTVQDVIAVTATSVLYGVTYSWFVEPQNWTTDGGPPLIELKTEQVNAVMEAPHVQGFRTVQEQNPSRLLVNYALIEVGTADRSIVDEVKTPMDNINSPAVFGAIDKTWERLNTIAGGGLV